MGQVPYTMLVSFHDDFDKWNPAIEPEFTYHNLFEKVLVH